MPDPFDPTPIERGIGVYYTDLTIGRVSFAIIEDRKFKTGPLGLLPDKGWRPDRPDHISNPDYRWRYVGAVRTDIRYGSQDNKYDKPELQFFQNILMNGGVCGRRAFFGRFILRAFGVPTTRGATDWHRLVTGREHYIRDINDYWKGYVDNSGTDKGLP